MPPGTTHGRSEVSGARRKTGAQKRLPREVEADSHKHLHHVARIVGRGRAVTEPCVECLQPLKVIIERRRVRGGVGRADGQCFHPWILRLKEQIAMTFRWPNGSRMAGSGMAVLLLTACATTPEPRIEIREVKVPIAVKCAVDPGPESPFSDTPEALRAAEDIFAKVRLLLAGRAQRDARLTELKASVSGCR